MDDSGNLYVANTSNWVLIFAPNANGNVAPIGKLNIGKAGLYGLAFDLHGDLYVTVDAARKVYEYAPGARGMAKPVRNVGGSLLGDPDSAVVDAQGNLFVSTISENNESSVKIYGPTAHDDAQPIRTIHVSAWPFQIAIVP